MYYDDPYDPNLENDIDEYDLSDSQSNQSSSDNTYGKKQRKLLDDVKASDPGYFKIKREVNFKKVKIELYADPITPGRSIRNAVTGVRQTGFKVGSRDELIFYKVALKTGEKGLRGQGPILFYDSPEQYERHMHVTCDERTKADWHARYRSEQIRRDRLEQIA